MKSTSLAVAFAILAWVSAGRADYLEIRRNAHLRSRAERSSETILKLPPGTLVEVRNETQSNGYYEVRTRDQKIGYVYRTLVRRHRGTLPPAPSSTNAVADEDASRSSPLPTHDISPSPPSPPFDPDEPLRSNGEPEMRAHLINVGQGAAMLLEFACGTALIDTGGEKNGSFDGESSLSGYLEAFFGARPALNRTIDLLVITHPHLDHVGNAKRVYTDFSVKNVITNGQTTGSGSHAQQELETWARAQATKRPSCSPAISSTRPSTACSTSMARPCSTSMCSKSAITGRITEPPASYSPECHRRSRCSEPVIRLGGRTGRRGSTGTHARTSWTNWWHTLSERVRPWT
jgi:hypothetical protein